MALGDLLLGPPLENLGFSNYLAMCFPFLNLMLS